VASVLLDYLSISILTTKEAQYILQMPYVIAWH